MTYPPTLMCAEKDCPNCHNRHKRQKFLRSHGAVIFSP